MWQDKKINIPKIVDYRDAITISKNNKVCLTNGIFDILHFGHLVFLESVAKNIQEEAGDDCFIIIGLNSDKSAKKLKRPYSLINNYSERAYILSLFPFIDFIFSFDTVDFSKQILEISPTFYCKAANSESELNPKEFKALSDCGSTIRLIEPNPFYSTAKIIEKIKNA